MKRFFCAIWDHIEYLFIIILFIGVFYLAFSQGSYAEPVSRENDPNYYANKIFDKTHIHTVEVNISDQNLQNLLDNAVEKSKYHVTTIIDGEKYDDVAFSTRGNGSVGTVQYDENTDRYNYVLNFKKYNSRQSYHGLDKLILNGLYFEPSYLRTALAFMITNSTGIKAPLFSFVNLYINGEHKGLYLSFEAIDHSYLERTGASLDAALFHPVPYDVDYDRQRRDGQYLADGEELGYYNSHIDSSANTYGGSDLVYRGEDPSNYNSIFMNATTKHSRADESLVIDGIESLSEITLKSPEEYWDIDALAKFFAASTIIYNTDSYLGVLAQNYYLQVSNQKLSLIPWDFDRAFSSNGFEKSSEYDDTAVNWPIDAPTMGVSTDERPAWRIISENPNYLQRYHDALQNVIDSYLISGECQQDLSELVELIRSYVYDDPTRIYSTEDFENEVKYLDSYITDRADAIQKQLWNID